MKIPSLNDVQETWLHISDMANKFRKKYPDVAEKLEKKAVEAFEEHWGDSRFLQLNGQCYNVFQLCESYLDENCKSRFTYFDSSYWLKDVNVGLFQNKKQYTLVLPDDQYVVIDAILTYARNHNISASFAWTGISPKAMKRYSGDLKKEPYWYAIGFDWSAITLEHRMSVTVPSDHTVWFGIVYDFTRNYR